MGMHPSPHLDWPDSRKGTEKKSPCRILYYSASRRSLPHREITAYWVTKGGEKERNAMSSGILRIAGQQSEGDAIWDSSLTPPLFRLRSRFQSFGSWEGGWKEE